MGTAAGGREGRGEREEEEEHTRTFKAMTCSRRRAISITVDCVASVQEEDHVRSMPWPHLVEALLDATDKMTDVHCEIHKHQSNYAAIS